MTDIGRVLSDNYDNYDNSSTQADNSKQEDIKLEDISLLYTTDKQELDRSTFAESYSAVEKDASKQGQIFLDALADTNNKAELMTSLGITSEQYDALACTALALASQETGMGEEKGYESENKGIGKLIRSAAKAFTTTFKGDMSASSGLTQMKIYDFLNSDSFPQEYKDIMESFGIEAKGVNNNNLFKNPDKAAIATMVVLKSINDNYQNYKKELETQHERIAGEIASTPEELEAAAKKGEELFDNIMNLYQNAPENQKDEIRSAFKNWLMAQNGSKIGDKNVDKEYNEELLMNNFNKILQNNNANFQLDENSLQLLRYVLTANGNEMGSVEYMAYGWNKGTGETGMQLDRMLAEKIGTLMQNPEDLDYDQFTANVIAMAERYANQSIGFNGLKLMNDAFA